MVLDFIISEQQIVFTPNRQIYDNIVVVHEIIHTLKKKRVGSYGSATIKLYMSKDFDE